MAISLLNSTASAYPPTNGAHRDAPQSSTIKAATEKECELGQKQQEKETEILAHHANSKRNASRKDHEVQSLLYDQNIRREAPEKRETDIFELSNRLKKTLEKKDQEIKQLRGYCNEIFRAHESQLRNSKTLQRDADTEARTLREKLIMAEKEVETCKDDLFRVQPVCQISDASIIDAFESLAEHLINWIDIETSAFERANQDVHVEHLFSGSKDPNVEQFLRKYPAAGEYVCRHIVNRYLIENMFGPNIDLFGLSAEYTHTMLAIEHGMAALKPPRDPQAVNIWRAETLRALAATPKCKDLRKAHTNQWTLNIFGSLSAVFPHMFRGVEALRRFHDQVTVPATTIVSKLQGSVSAYRLEMAGHDLTDRGLVTKDDLKKVVAVDLETGKTLKPDIALVGDREGVIGEYVLSLEPSLHRVNVGSSETDLRKETWLVRRGHGIGSRTPRGD